jgi:membrane fusion protein, multidrug efflux system
MRKQIPAAIGLTLLTSLAVVGSTLGAATLLGGCSEVAASTEAAEAAPMPVGVFVAQEVSHYAITQSFTGTARSRRDARLGFERGGLVARVRVEEGDRVERGQVVAVLDTGTLVAERRRLLAQRGEVDAGLGIAELTAQRLDKLQAERFASTQQRDEARFAVKRSQAQRGTLDAAVAAIDVELHKSRLVAPFAGTVAARLVDEGTVVAPGAAVVRFLDEASPEAVVGVPITVAASMPVGSMQRISFAGTVVQAKVTAQVRDVDPRTRTTDVILELPTDRDVLGGQIVRLLHERTIAERGFWIPRTALTEGLRGLWSAYGVKDERVVRHELEVLYTDGERAFVRGTLVHGDRLVRAGLHRVVPGQRVAVSNGTSEPKAGG